MESKDKVKQQRIIPACAGSTWSRRFEILAKQDHPRMRGEHSNSTSSANPTTGSSPHARGALSKLSPPVKAYGIIPACAGSTRRDSAGD